MVYNKDLLDGISQVTRENIRRVYLPDDNALDIACVGRCKLDSGDTINNVLCIPKLHITSYPRLS